MSYGFEKCGEVVAENTLSMNVPVGQTKSVNLNLDNSAITGEYVYTVSAVLSENTSWADEGYEIAFAQEIVEVKGNTPNPETAKPTIVYGDVIIGVHGKNFSMLFDKKEGGISSLSNCFTNRRNHIQARNHAFA